MRVGPNSDVPASFRKSSNKSRIARLKRIGPVTFELLQTVDQLRDIIGVVAEQSDVRHGGRSAFLPFRADALKAQLYLELMAEPGLVHATVLRAGTEIIATHIGLRDRIPALGLMTHAPQYGAHSPGKLLLLYLGKLLGEEGYTVFDLTPGRRYKERFASHFDDVSVLEVFLDRASHAKFRTKRMAANVSKWLVKAVGRDPKASFRRVARISERIRRAGPIKLARMAAELVVRQTHSNREFRIYEFSLTERIGEQQELGRMRVNSLRDLLDYSPASPSDPPIIEFLETAERRLANGNLLFSYAEGGKLLHYGWLIPAADWMGSEFGHDIPLRERPTVLWDDFTHPSARGQGLHGESLRARLSYIAAHELSVNAMIGVRSDNLASRRNIESMGFAYAGSAWIATRFGKVRRWVKWEDPSREGYVSTGKPERRGAEVRDE
jgi:RimJ/RimL family protein N-acetyltransferase